MAGSSPESYWVAPESTVSSLVAKRLVAAVERAGVPRERFMNSARLDPSVLDSEHRVPIEDVFAWCETALDLTNDPALGLHWGEWMTVHTFNLVPQLLAHARTLRGAFEALFQFSGLLTDHLNMHLVERDDEAELQLTPFRNASPRMRRFVAEMSMLGMHHMLRDFCPHATIRRVDFAYPAPDYRAEYARIFRSSERFGQACTGVVFDRELLNASSSHHDGDIQGSLRVLAERRLSAIQRRAPYSMRVRELLLRERAPHRVAMLSIARALDVSLRSLHRRLVDEGQSYTAIANEASANVAKRLLADEHLTIQEAASAMGFCDATSFHRAFKRWTGTTPTKFRAHW
jgi:AraC-like DNA-binding protein